MGSKLHENAVVVDGLIIANFTREVFEDMRKGGLTAANCTCSVWENFRGSMDNVARWKRHFTDNADLITQVHTTADIHRAKRKAAPASSSAGRTSRASRTRSASCSCSRSWASA